MFTGIIQELGVVAKIERKPKFKTFAVQSGKILKGKVVGQSIAVNGVCVTIKKLSGRSFQFDAITETLKLTNLKNLKLNDKINLEESLKLGSSIDGHFISGHVDAEGIVEKFTNNRLTIKFPANLQKFIAYKGSIAINGVSLTISGLKSNTFTVDLIPETVKKTNLANLRKNAKVNLEVDLIARYLNSLLNANK